MNSRYNNLWSKYERNPYPKWQKFDNIASENKEKPDIYVTKVRGPSIICPGAYYEFRVVNFNMEFGGLGEIVKFINWGYSIDDGNIIEISQKGEGVVGVNEVKLNWKIPVNIIGTYLKVYAWIHVPSPLVFASASIQTYPFMFFKYKEKGLDKNAIKIADDMCYGDGVNITDHFRYTRNEIEDLGILMKYYTLTDSQNSLWMDLRLMAKNFFSIGSLEKVAMKLVDNFKQNKGTMFSDVVLTQKVTDNKATKDFCIRVEKSISNTLKDNLFNPLYLKNENRTFLMDSIGRPQYSTLKDTFLGGLTVCLNDIWAYEVCITGCDYNNSRSGTIKYKVILYDHFGLNMPDIQKVFYNLAGFRAWFVLQHIYNFQPFIVKIEFEKSFKI
jgi:hypothetical protein